MTELELLTAAQTGPLAVTLARAVDGKAVLYMGSHLVGDNKNVLRATLTNLGDAALALRGGVEPAHYGSDDGPSTLYLFLAPKLLASEDLTRISADPGWVVACRAIGQHNHLAICPASDLIVQPRASANFLLADITTAREDPASVSITLEHARPPAKALPRFERMRPGPGDLGVTVGMSGEPTSIYTSEQDVFEIRNDGRCVVLKNTDRDKPWAQGVWDRTPSFTLSFQVADADAPGALTTPARARVVDATAEDHQGWFVRKHEDLTWILEPNRTYNRSILAPAATTCFRIDNVVTYFKPGVCLGRLKWENVPGYRDSYMHFPLTKQEPPPTVERFTAPAEADHGASMTLTWKLYGGVGELRVDDEVVRSGIGPGEGRCKVVLRSAAAECRLSCERPGAMPTFARSTVRAKKLRVAKFAIAECTFGGQLGTGPLHAKTTVEWETEGTTNVRIVDTRDPARPLLTGPGGVKSVELIGCKGTLRLVLTGADGVEVVAEAAAEAADYAAMKARHGRLDGLYYSAGTSIKRWWIDRHPELLCNIGGHIHDMSAVRAGRLLFARSGWTSLGWVKLPDGEPRYALNGLLPVGSVCWGPGSDDMTVLVRRFDRDEYAVHSAPFDDEVNEVLWNDPPIAGITRRCRVRAGRYFATANSIRELGGETAELGGHVIVDFDASRTRCFWIDASTRTLWTALVGPFKDKVQLCAANREQDSTFVDLTHDKDGPVWVEAEAGCKVLYGFVDGARTRLIALEGPLGPGAFGQAVGGLVLTGSWTVDEDHP